MSNLEYAPVMLSELAARVRSGDLRPRDLVDEALRRVEATSPLNAVTEVWADEAREAADHHAGNGPLAGLPLLIKDMVRVAGHRVTLGSRLFADAPVDGEDDVAVARLRAAGAIPLGRTNTPEFGAVGFTSNALYGTTVNPWNTAFTPGGSSGGSAAALAAGVVPLATTSDGGGSVRAPASFCGLVGHKPTAGVIGRNYLPRWIEFSTQGATASTVADVVLQMQIMQGPAVGDFLSLPESLDLRPVMPAKVYATRSFRSDVDEEIEVNFRRTVEALEKSGVPVEWVESPTDEAAVLTWFIISCTELTQSLAPERDRFDELSTYVQDQVRVASRFTLDDYLAASRQRAAVSARFEKLLGNDAVLLSPTVNVRSFGPEGPLPTSAGKATDNPSVAYNTTDANLTGLPATSVPMGLDRNGVPTGLQISGGRFRDSLCLGLAAHIEKIQPWPLVAPGYEPFGL
jgi:Asp-tRNA(Asn)/Glu-tRNA(Gln) amidotransferase A subunit family amidase